MQATPNLEIKVLAIAAATAAAEVLLSGTTSAQHLERSMVVSRNR